MNLWNKKKKTQINLVDLTFDKHMRDESNKKKKIQA